MVSLHTNGTANGKIALMQELMVSLFTNGTANGKLAHQLNASW